ncbi:hypothetical protein HN51_052160 [Arachis hypogaea]|uniref:DUF620 domain-containing protein n=2 Tax=Arachis TaxID=3817 RepID=A0A445BQW7_ARAHY|nr:uncharacterized protein LOC107460014 [Arachis duranensis]XP_016165676.1 uncharacterized protein LOC107608388 [Arachis ipaensis]XP_025612163.1 uncharacterized protein LOC112705538 [Arachis hypogaea]XP_025668619.1 uncharacterized protein LOC112766941 [Arachis hypogaea]XP_057728716.1 uncharacterized protein LOC130944414 [Arachis stenosperma]QHO29251.1 uncharacterized protein DS421_8g223620 [Arachis hypogaea]RYR41085.1 hypothetical protein Ahy_A08g037485 [Arachis hypogaea]RYR48423.1 hypotheti
MRKLCPNLDDAEGLETVLEVPIPEEMLTALGSNGFNRWHTLRALMNSPSSDMSSHLSAPSYNEFMVLLKLVGAPLIPLPVQSDNTLTRPLKDCSIRDSTAKYIVQQYVAATGGHSALNSVKSMYAMGQVRICGSEMRPDEEIFHPTGRREAGGFVLWQKNPDLWCIELVVSGFKVSAGSDGKLAWNQSSSQPFQANKGPPRPLRRFFQGLDPRCIANLFLDAECVGENTINDEVCFILKLQTDQQILQAQCTSHTEIVMHSVLGYFSQRTGLLVKFEDTKLVKMKPVKGKESVFWETTIESTIEDYRYVDGINIAHGGKTIATLHRYGAAHHHKRMIEEVWTIEEVDFNVIGLSNDCFLPPSDIDREHDGADNMN